jgi:hypothetical protein
MLMFEDLTDEQIQSCLTEGIDLERFKRIALTTQKLIPNYDGQGHISYLISDVHTAAVYCKEILNTFSSAEYTESWETEFNTHFNAVREAGHKVNEILTSE